MMKIFHRIIISGAAICALTLACWVIARDADQIQQSDSEILPLADQSLLTGIARADAGLFAVGERGHILFSADGSAWRQFNVPTRSNFTSVFALGKKIWAVGHDGVIVHSADSGQSWALQRYRPWSPETYAAEDGIPLLDVHFSDRQNGFAIGAFALILRTTDGGATWVAEPMNVIDDAAQEEAPVAASTAESSEWVFDESDLELEAGDDPHLNAIARLSNGNLLIVGERGSVFRSADDGASWHRLAFPYEGSLFGILNWKDSRVMVYGLRGRVFESSDFGDTWSDVSTDSENSLMGGVALDNGGAVLVGLNGTVLRRDSADQSFTVFTHENRDQESVTLAGIYKLDSAFVLVGEKGVELTKTLGQAGK